ncbi:MAG: hypothetical protein EHM83_03395 [Burkholderiales bacterium]|nr:MAG: hypothetical protein EHM83_03395 [Burkholderiales bacterium]
MLLDVDRTFFAPGLRDEINAIAVPRQSCAQQQTGLHGADWPSFEPPRTSLASDCCTCASEASPRRRDGLRRHRPVSSTVDRFVRIPAPDSAGLIIW